MEEMELCATYPQIGAKVFKISGSKYMISVINEVDKSVREIEVEGNTYESLRYALSVVEKEIIESKGGKK